ncbi:MAG: purine-nucleoside phosphorylase [Salibacteraceae bacterium]
MRKKIEESIAFFKEKGFEAPVVGIVLGTGLGGLVDLIDIDLEVEYDKIPHFPVATVEFHKGKLVYGQLNGIRVIAMVGRFHFYEGYSLQEITHPIRVLKGLGIKNLIVSNAAGGINLDYSKSDLMLIEDHINLLPGNPLIGENLDEFGPRFPDMSEPYSRKLNKLFHSIAKEKSIDVKEGVYVSVMGPNLETRAEYRYLKTIGADAVGMSTVPEVIVANHMNLPVCAISVITDLCDPSNLEKVNIEDIIAAALKGEQKLIEIIPELVCRLEV